MTALSLAELADLVEGRVVGSEDLKCTDALPLQDAGENHLTLVDHVKHAAKFSASRAMAAIVPRQHAEAIHEATNKSAIAVDDIHASFIKAIQHLRQAKLPVYSGIDSRATVHATAVVGEHTHIGSGSTVAFGCVIGKNCRIHAGVHLMKGCRIGDDCEIFPGAVLYPETVLGDRVILHANAVLGAYGFGYRTSDGKHIRTAQLGWVEIEDDVEIGAATTIDRGTYGPTIIGTGTKIDNLVQIGHNNHVGKHNLMCAQVGIAGSCSTGDYVVFAGQTGVRDHVHIGNRVMTSAQSGVAADIEDGQTVLGSPALPQREAMQIFFASKHVPDMRKELRELRAMLEKLEASQSHSEITPLRAAKAA
jgi:UDP-3-O-[3-hydroxymyristoyl] glucosamine N-acyltransferase